LAVAIAYALAARSAAATASSTPVATPGMRSTAAHFPAVSLKLAHDSRARSCNPVTAAKPPRRCDCNDHTEATATPRSSPTETAGAAAPISRARSSGDVFGQIAVGATRDAAEGPLQLMGRGIRSAGSKPTPLHIAATPGERRGFNAAGLSAAFVGQYCWNDPPPPDRAPTTKGRLPLSSS